MQTAEHIVPTTQDLVLLVIDIDDPYLVLCIKSAFRRHYLQAIERGLGGHSLIVSCQQTEQCDGAVSFDAKREMLTISFPRRLSSLAPCMQNMQLHRLLKDAAALFRLQSS